MLRPMGDESDKSPPEESTREDDDAHVRAHLADWRRRYGNAAMMQRALLDDDE